MTLLAPLLLLLPLQVESLTLKHVYRDKEVARYSYSVEGDFLGTDLKVDAKLVQTARVPKTGQAELKVAVEKISVKVNGKADSTDKMPLTLYRIEPTGKLVGGWIPEQKTAIGLAFLPYLFYGITYELGKGQSLSYSDPNVRGYTVNGTARWLRKGKLHEFQAVAQVRGAQDRGRPTVVSLECSFDARDGRLLTSRGFFSTALQAASPEVSRRPKMNGLEFELVRL